MDANTVRSDRRPLYQQAESALMARIMEGVYHPGQQLPPEGELAGSLGVSRTTIRGALGNLETRGFIQRIHGMGTFVAQRRFKVEADLENLESFHPRLAARMGRTSKISHLDISEMPADSLIAEQMGLHRGDLVVRVARTVEIDEVPVVFLQEYLPTSTCTAETLRTTFVDSMVDYFDGRDGRPTIEWSQSDLEAIRADKALAELLQVAEGDILFRLDESFYGNDSRLAMWSRNFLVPEYFKFHVRRRVTHG